MIRFFLVVIVSLALGFTACGGSADPEAPPPATSSSDAISEADAIANAEAAASERGFSAEGLDVKASQLFGEWQISFEPPGDTGLTGGFLVVLEASTGEIIDVVEYR